MNLHVRFFPTRNLDSSANSSLNYARKTMSKTLCFSSIQAPGSTLHSTDTDSDFETRHVEIGVLLNVSFKR